MYGISQAPFPSLCCHATPPHSLPPLCIYAGYAVQALMTPLVHRGLDTDENLDILFGDRKCVQQVHRETRMYCLASPPPGSPAYAMVWYTDYYNYICVYVGICCNHTYHYITSMREGHFCFDLCLMHVPVCCC